MIILKDGFRHFQKLHVQPIHTLPVERSQIYTPVREVLCCCSAAAGTEKRRCALKPGQMSRRQRYYDTVSLEVPDVVVVELTNQRSAMLLIMHELFISLLLKLTW